MHCCLVYSVSGFTEPLTPSKDILGDANQANVRPYTAQQHGGRTFVGGRGLRTRKARRTLRERDAEEPTKHGREAMSGGALADDGERRASTREPPW